MARIFRDIQPGDLVIFKQGICGIVWNVHARHQAWENDIVTLFMPMSIPMYQHYRMSYIFKEGEVYR